MIRKIIRINKDKCNGCGTCADACHEGAIDIINGKAELMREHFCNGWDPVDALIKICDSTGNIVNINF